MDFFREFPINNEHYTADSLANDFFDRVKDRHKKHFDQWRHNYLYLVLGGESISASYTDSFILGRELLSGLHISITHKTIINVDSMGAFLPAEVLKLIFSQKLFKLHHNALFIIS